VSDVERRLRDLAELCSELGPALMPRVHEELLRSITAAAMRLFGAEACSLALVHEEREELVFYASSGGRAQEVDGMRIPIGHGIAGWVAASGQAIMVEDVERDPRFASDVARSLGHTPNAILALPLQTDRGILGVIEVLDPTGDERNRMDLLGVFAHQAALAIESSRVFSSFGRVLFEAAARVGDPDLASTLRAIAREKHGDSQTGELAEIAALFEELRRAGPDEARLAAGVLREFLAYAGRRRT
jgi:GAF domain-containing protein